MSFLKRKKPKINLVQRKKPKITTDGLPKNNEMGQLDTPKENIEISNYKDTKSDANSLKSIDLFEDKDDGANLCVQQAEGDIMTTNKKSRINDEEEKDNEDDEDDEDNEDDYDKKKANDGNDDDAEEANDDEDNDADDYDDDADEDSSDGLPRLGDLLGTNKQSPDYLNDIDIESLYSNSLNVMESLDNDDTQMEMFSNEEAETDKKIGLDKKEKKETLTKGKSKEKPSKKTLEMSAMDEMMVEKETKTNDEPFKSDINKFANDTKANKNLLSLANDTLGKSVESPKSMLNFNERQVNESNNTEVEQPKTNLRTKNHVANALDSRTFTNSNLVSSLLTDINQTSNDSAYINNEIFNIDSTRKNIQANSDIGTDNEIEQQFEKIFAANTANQQLRDAEEMIVEENKGEEGTVSSSLDSLENIFGENPQANQNENKFNMPINDDALPAALLTNPVKLTINDKGDIVEETAVQSSFKNAEDTQMEVENEPGNKNLLSKEELTKALAGLGPELSVMKKKVKKKKLLKKKIGGKSSASTSEALKQKAKASGSGNAAENIDEQVDQEEKEKEKPTAKAVDKNILFPTQFILEPQVLKSPIPNGQPDVVIQPVFNITERAKPPDYTALPEPSSMFYNPIETQDASLPSELLSSDSTANGSNIPTLQSCGQIGEGELVRGFEGKLASGFYHMQKVKEDIYSMRRVNDIPENTAPRTQPASPRNETSATCSARAAQPSRSVPNACAGQPVDITNILLEDNNCFEISNNRVEIYTPNEPLGRLNSRRRNIIVEERPRATNIDCLGPTTSTRAHSIYEMPRNRPVMVTRATQTPIHMSIPTSTPRPARTTIPIYTQTHAQTQAQSHAQPFIQMPILNTTITTRTWSTAESFRFYDCVRVFKTDFRTIVRLFPDRDLEQIVLKFRMENHHNADLMAILLTDMENVDIRNLISEHMPTTTQRQFIFDPMNYINQENVYTFDDNQTVTITDNSPPNIETLCAIPLTIAQEQSLRRIIELNQILHRTYAQYNKNSNIRINPNKEIISEVLNLCVKGLNDGYLVVGKELCSKTGNSFEVFTRNRISGKIAGSLKLCSFLVVAIVGLMNL